MPGTKELDKYVLNDPFISGFRHMAMVVGEGITMNQIWLLFSILSS